MNTIKTSKAVYVNSDDTCGNPYRLTPYVTAGKEIKTMNITKTIYTVECYQNGESMDFLRGWKVRGGIHHYYEEFETLEEAQEDIRRIKEDFAMRDNSIYDQAYCAVLDKFADPDSDEARKDAEEAADKTLKEFMAHGKVSDYGDDEYYGIREFEVFDINEYEAAEIMANSEHTQFRDLCQAFKRLGVEIEPVDYSEYIDKDEDPMAAAQDENFERLDGKLANYRRFVGLR